MSTHNYIYMSINPTVIYKCAGFPTPPLCCCSSCQTPPHFRQLRLPRQQLISEKPGLGREWEIHIIGFMCDQWQTASVLTAESALVFAGCWKWPIRWSHHRLNGDTTMASVPELFHWVCCSPAQRPGCLKVSVGGADTSTRPHGSYESLCPMGSSTGEGKKIRIIITERVSLGWWTVSLITSCWWRNRCEK